MPGTRRGGECRLVAQMLLCFKKLPKITMTMCDSFWNIFWMANIFQNLGWVKWIINLEICRRDQPDQKMIDHVSGLSWNLPFCSWAGGWNKVSWWVFVWEGYGNQIFDMLTSRYQPVYMAVCIGLATFIFSQLVNLHWWDSGKNASFFQMFGALIIIMFFFYAFFGRLGD